MRLKKGKSKYKLKNIAEVEAVRVKVGKIIFPLMRLSDYHMGRSFTRGDTSGIPFAYSFRDGVLVIHPAPEKAFMATVFAVERKII